ncbi:unnamed protein product [Gongylonema pulchrum]|uniref:Rho-GAP domain-containing protein n=1 Tax=Gongylonema pulchrum TaxID=637853 RepID=A0A183D943_9BILA|nr:unnamed protein product [Gongylonema pulchrum]
MHSTIYKQAHLHTYVHLQFDLVDLQSYCRKIRKTGMAQNEIVKILLEYIREENRRDSKVLDFHHPAEMQKLIDLSIPDHPRTLQQLLQDCQEVLRLGVRTGHPRFFNQISCGLDLVSMAGEWLTATANTNMYVLIVKMS